MTVDDRPLTFAAAPYPASERYIVDGCHPDGTLQGDGRKPPFYVFDQFAQENVAGPFQTRPAASAVRDVFVAHRTMHPSVEDHRP